jgi:hypothetical protein
MTLPTKRSSVAVPKNRRVSTTHWIVWFVVRLSRCGTESLRKSLGAGCQSVNRGLARGRGDGRQVTHHIIANGRKPRGGAVCPLGIYLVRADNSSMVSNPPMSVRSIAGIVALLLSYSQSTNGTVLALSQTADFGFRLETNRCLSETHDTFSGLLTKDLGGEPARSVRAQVSLTDSQMKTIRQTIEEIRFVDYPSSFVGVPTGLSEIMTFSPATKYRLEVHNRGVVHTVSWNDAHKPTTEEADRLRGLFSMIIGFIHDHPAFRQLPPQIGSCL